VWHGSIAKGDHECMEGVMEYDCALADSNAFIADSNMHCDTDRYISDSKRGADKSLARPGRKQATATEDFDVHISYLLS